MFVRLSSALFVTTLLVACGDTPSSSSEGQPGISPEQFVEQPRLTG